MKNYKLYILALLLVIASQSLLAIDGWWEKVETKNYPDLTKDGVFLNISDGNVIKFSVFDTNTSKTDLTPKPVTDIWFFNLDLKEWSHLQFDFPISLWEDYKKTSANKTFAKFSDNKILAYFNDNRTLLWDSSTWIIDIEKQTWRMVEKTTGTRVNNGIVISQIKDNVVLIYQIEKLTPSSETYVFDSKLKIWQGLGYEEDSTYFRRQNGKLFNIAEGKVVFYGGYPYTVGGTLPYDTFNLWQFDYETKIWNKCNYNINHEYLTTDLVKLYDNVVFTTKGAWFRTYNGVFYNDSNSYIMDFKNKNYFKKIDVLNNDSIGKRITNLCRIKDGKVLLIGGIKYKKYAAESDAEVANDTWIFHADPALSVEGLESKNPQLRKIFIEDKLLITQDLLDNRQIVNAKLLNLLGSEIDGIELVGNEVKFDCATGTYILSIKLDNQEEIRFVIIKN